jgi:predicted HicB family RNase H-like nuclease
MKIKKKPEQAANTPLSEDAWVSGQPAAATPASEERIKRLTIDVPESLHTRAKAQAAQQRVTLREEMVKFLEKRFPAPHEQS